MTPSMSRDTTSAGSNSVPSTRVTLLHSAAAGWAMACAASAASVSGAKNSVTTWSNTSFALMWARTDLTASHLSDSRMVRPVLPVTSEPSTRVPPPSSGVTVNMLPP